MQAFRLGQEPMQTDDLQSRCFSLTAESLASFGGNIGNPGCQSKGSDFDAGVSGLGNKSALAFPVPTFK